MLCVVCMSVCLRVCSRCFSVLFTLFSFSSQAIHTFERNELTQLTKLACLHFSVWIAAPDTLPSPLVCKPHCIWGEANLSHDLYSMGGMVDVEPW